MTGAYVSAVCIVHTLWPEQDNPGGLTAIDKRAVPGRVPVGALGLAGDRQLDTDNHGGLDQALYAYADEDAAWWAADLNREISPGLFGENLRTAGLDVSAAVIGERWRIGSGADSFEVEVTSPRTPCMTFQRRMAEEHWVKRFAQHGACGAYLRVLQDGSAGAGDQITVEHRPEHGVTIADAFLSSEPAVMRRLLDADLAGSIRLAANMRAHAERAAARADG